MHTTQVAPIASVSHNANNKPVKLTENQRKVVQDKYLKSSPSVEAWLRNVARNIALAEILYHPQSPSWGVFEGVKFTVVNSPGHRDKPSNMVLFHKDFTDISDMDRNFSKFVKNLNRVSEHVPEAGALVSEVEEQFYELMSTWSFLPNSPTLMNAGRELQQLSACYVLPVEDSMEAITKSLAATALIHKSGGGTGFSFGRVRPAGDEVKSTQGVASGAISFMQIFDKMTEVVKQGGTRRGANMGILPYWHPEIKEFIALKSKPGVMENFNISVAVDAKFMEAVEKDLAYDLINPRNGQPAGKAEAREIFNLMVEGAHRTGDPGLIVIDRINNSYSNPVPVLGEIESTNPCGEQPLLPHEACNLGSINLFKFVHGSIGKAEIDWAALESCIRVAIRFLDNVIDMNNYPLPEIEFMSKGNRRIGLGVMGWAETLVCLGLPYDSEEALNAGREVMRFISDNARKASEQLALERGVFPNWSLSIYNPSSKYFCGQAVALRNSACTTIAPTGTIGIAAGLQGAGIEPFFAIAYTRYNARALEAVKKHEKPDASDVFYEVNPLFRQVAEDNNYFGLGETKLWKAIESNHKAVRGVKEIPEHIQKLFATAHDVSVEYHVGMQAAFQEHTDNAVSKTINMSRSATIDDVKNAYLLAYKSGCKGLTIYRDGSKDQQVLNLVSGENGDAAATRPARDFSQGVSSEYYEIKTGYGPLHVHIDYDPNGPYRIFTSIPPLGTEISGLTAVLGILLSKYFEIGGDPVRTLKHLQSVKGDRPYGFGENRINSIPHALAIALRMHLKKTGKLKDVSETKSSGLELWNVASIAYCTQCYSNNVSFEAGCSEPVCHDCGYSVCS